MSTNISLTQNNKSNSVVLGEKDNIDLEIYSNQGPRGALTAEQIAMYAVINNTEVSNLKDALAAYDSGLLAINNEIVGAKSTISTIQNQVDGNISTWFYSYGEGGAPSASTEPEVSWTTEEDRANHVGDLAFNKDDGTSYRYVNDGVVYGWVQINDNAISEALSLAQQAQTTADSKNTVFAVDPYTPYKVGDLWVSDTWVKKATISRDTGLLVESDWVEIATKNKSDEEVEAAIAAAASAAQEASIAEAYAYTDGVVTASEAAIVANYQAYADQKKTEAQAYADGIVTASEQLAIDAAAAYTDASQINAIATSNAYADGVITAKEATIMEATQAYADAKKVEANAYADGIVTVSEANAIATAQAYADLKKTEADAYADGIVTAAEQRAIDEAGVALAAAQAAQQSADEKWVYDASTIEAIASAKADLAEASAKAYADGVITPEEQAILDGYSAKVAELENDITTAQQTADGKWEYDQATIDSSVTTLRPDATYLNSNVTKTTVGLSNVTNDAQVKADGSNAPSSLLNSSITIGSDGTLAGAGGGQVTIGGLGYTGALDATKNRTDSATDTLISTAEANAKSYADLQKLDWNLSSSYLVVEDSGRTVRRIDTGTAWDKRAYSTNFSVGSAYLRFTSYTNSADTDSRFMMGLTTDPTASTSYNTIDFAIYCNSYVSAGDIVVYENGGSKGTIQYGAPVGTVCEIIYNGSKIIYKTNGVIRRTVDVASGLKLYVTSSLLGKTQIENIAFGTSVSADMLIGSTLQSSNWSTSAGSQFDLNGGTFQLGGSSNPSLEFTGTALNINADINVAKDKTLTLDTADDASLPATIEFTSSDGTNNMYASALRGSAELDIYSSSTGVGKFIVGYAPSSPTVSAHRGLERVEFRTDGTAGTYMIHNLVGTDGYRADLSMRSTGLHTFILDKNSGESSSIDQTPTSLTFNKQFYVSSTSTEAIKTAGGIVASGTVTAPTFSGTATNSELLDGYDSSDFVLNTRGYENSGAGSTAMWSKICTFSNNVTYNENNIVIRVNTRYDTTDYYINFYTTNPATTVGSYSFIGKAISPVNSSPRDAFLKINNNGTGYDFELWVYINAWGNCFSKVIHNGYNNSDPNITFTTGSSATKPASDYTYNLTVQSGYGDGSGLDADKLDGYHASQFLRSDASNVITGDNRSLSFGTAGAGATTGARFLSIEGNSDGSGEGSGRIFFTEHNSTTAGMDNYGMSIGYRGGDTNIVGASGNTWTGLSQIGNGEWGMWGHDGSSDGSLIAHGPRSGSYTDFTNLLIGGNQVWHAGNDGSGSGLDADKLDGVQASQFLRSDTDDTFTNLTGSSVSLGTGYTATIANSAHHFATPSGYIDIGPMNSSWAHIYTDRANFYFNKNLYVLGNKVWHAGNDGAGSGLDADTLDGVQGSSFLRSDTSDTFTDLSGTSLTIGSGVTLAESSDRADLLQISSNTSTWAGLQIRNTSSEGRWSFMTDGSASGIYDDENNKWHIYMVENSYTDLRYNGYTKFATTSTGVSVTGTITETSDKRLKSDIQKIDNALDKVSQINGYTFNMKDTGKRLTGVIAQEVAKVLPEAVQTNENEYLSVSYGNMVGLLIESIKELNKKVEDQQNIIDNLLKTIKGN